MLRKATKKDYKQAGEPIYKVVREEKSGGLRSLFIEGTKGRPAQFPHGMVFALTYKPHMVISDGDYGIWCCETLSSAKHQASINGPTQLCRIYKVKPIGTPIEPPAAWEENGQILYPAIIMGELVETIDRR
ncbi:hypothetical protein LCGC14_2088390 [marine sediment metagenome]|uniref:Uncharacterized protein n=1 Tax=marine sediment metagenome TaxID=412755 RepID=A0A0F9HAG1_9ZZZZ